MTCRGVLFALDNVSIDRLLKIKGNDELIDYVYGEIEEGLSEQWVCQTDKAWEAIHRCLTGGGLDTNDRPYPLALCILGGKQLYQAKSSYSQDYLFCFVNPLQVIDVANALELIDEQELHSRYWALDQDQYGGSMEENDWNYTLEYFNDVKAFYAKAAKSKRSVLFTVDQ